jgi:hypothetical protein
MMVIVCCQYVPVQNETDRVAAASRDYNIDTASKTVLTGFAENRKNCLVYRLIFVGFLFK